MSTKLIVVRTITALAVLISTTAFRDPTPTAAFACGDCEYDWTEGGGGGWNVHRFGSVGDLYTGPFHTNWIPGTCLGGGHDACGGEAFDITKVRRLEVLVHSGDWTSLLALTRSDRAITYNPDRNSIQSSDCAKRIVANYQLPSEAAEIIAGSE